MPERPAEVGEVIGGYQLENVLGQGGMGCVYEATHTRLGRRTALKLLAPALVSSAEYVSRFLSEAKIVNDVRHPNIVDIYDFIELEEPRRVAYVMELVEGPSLGGVLKQRRLSLRQAINATFQLVSALEAVHAVGVIHRDLKPDNILVLGDLDSDLSSVPSVKILDFGIAKTVDGDVSHKTITGSMLGTPSYMAPEQIAAHPVSAATDIYAIGEIFYEMVAGRRLFSGDRMPMLSKKLLGEVPSLIFPADLPAETSVRELVTWCLALDPEERPSIPELANALSELLVLASECEPAVAVEQAPVEHVDDTISPMASAIELPQLPARRPRWFPIAGVLAMLVAGAIGFVAYQQQKDEIAAPVVIEPPVIAVPAAEVEEPDAPPEAEAPPVESTPEAVEAKPVEPETKAPKTTKRKRTRRRPSRLEPKAPVPKEKKRVVKKRELVPW